MKSNSYGPLHPVAIFCFPYPNSFGTVRIVRYPPVARDMAGLSVMMERVPLDSPADPCSSHTDIGRLHHSIAVEYVIAVRLVDGIQKASSDFRKNTQFHIFILQIQTVVGNILLCPRHIVIQRVWIYTSLGTLV